LPYFTKSTRYPICPLSLQYDAHLPDENSTKHIHHMVAYICSLPDDGSLDKTIEPLTVDSGFRGNNFELIENPLLFDSCRKLVLASFHKGNEVIRFVQKNA